VVGEGWFCGRGRVVLWSVTLNRLCHRLELKNAKVLIVKLQYVLHKVHYSVGLIQT